MTDFDVKQTFITYMWLTLNVLLLFTESRKDQKYLKSEYCLFLHCFVFFFCSAFFTFIVSAYWRSASSCFTVLSFLSVLYPFHSNENSLFHYVQTDADVPLLCAVDGVSNQVFFFFLYLPGTAYCMFSLAEAVTMFRHSIMSYWKWITVDIFFLPLGGATTQPLQQSLPR